MGERRVDEPIAAPIPGTVRAQVCLVLVGVYNPFRVKDLDPLQTTFAVDDWLIQ